MISCPYKLCLQVRGARERERYARVAKVVGGLSRSKGKEEVKKLREERGEWFVFIKKGGGRPPFMCKFGKAYI